MTGKKLSLFLALLVIVTFFHCAEVAAKEESPAGAVLRHSNNLDTLPADDHQGEEPQEGSNPTNALLRASSSSTTARSLDTSIVEDTEVQNIFQSDTATPLCPYAIENKFEVLMSPDNNYHQNKFHVFRLFSNYTIDRKVLAQNSYDSAAPDQSTSRCLYTIFCYKLIVYDSAGDGICCEHGNGSYKAYWNGELIKHEQFLDGYQSVTYFGDCATNSPSISAVPSVTPPSASPSVSVSPSTICPPGQALFQMFMRPDSIRSRDVNYYIQRRKKMIFKRKVYSIRFFEEENLPVDNVCLNDFLCLRITVLSRGSRGIGDGEFSAKWNGEDVIFPDYDTFTNETVSSPIGSSC